MREIVHVTARRVWGTLIRHEEYKEMAAVHALGALDSAEAREFEAHLAKCEECRAELESWQDVAAGFAYAAPAVEPSADLRSRILDSVRAEGERQSPGLAAQDSDGKVAKERVVALREESNVIPLRKPARRATGAAAKIFAIAASVAFVALIISLILLWNRYNAMRHEMARLADRFDQTQGELARERETLADERAAKDLFSAPDALITSLAGTEMAENARAKFIFDRKTGRAMLMADGLPPAPEGKAYQLWFIADGKSPMPGRVFTPDAKGHAEMRAEVPAEARNANTFAVTLEPQGGTTTPTGPKYLLSAS
jgi:anti-sigma-K factor RskA